MGVIEEMYVLLSRTLVAREALCAARSWARAVLTACEGAIEMWPLPESLEYARVCVRLGMGVRLCGQKGVSCSYVTKCKAC